MTRPHAFVVFLTQGHSSSPVRAVLLLTLAAVSAGCALPWTGEDGGGATLPSTPAPPTPGAQLTFAGRVQDVVDARIVPDAEVLIDLAQVRPCFQEGIVWNQWSTATDAEGRFGPITVPVPRSSDVAFFVRVNAPTYADASLYVGPTQARAGVANLTLVLHPDADVRGTAAPGTVLALSWPDFPRLAVANETGAFAFPQAHATPMQIVADTSPPWRASLAAPATVDVPNGNGTAWRLEAFTRLDTGAPTEADVVAWSGADLVGVARAGENGFFVLPLDPEPRELRVEARTADGRFGGSKVLALNGPPATRENVILRALC